MIKRLPHYLHLETHENSSQRPFWMEDIKPHLNKLSANQASKISDYMKLAPMIMAWMGVIKDPMDPSNFIGTSEYSDGFFVWEDIHIHYVRKYRVDPPQVFIDHIEQYDGNFEHLNLLDENIIRKEMKRIYVNEKGVSVADDLTVRIGY